MASFDREFWLNLLRMIVKIILNVIGITPSVTTHNQHVVTHDDGWSVKGAGNERYAAVYRTKSEAIERAREIAINYGSDFIIHRSDESIRDRMSY